jgi:hypothetical protein
MPLKAGAWTLLFKYSVSAIHLFRQTSPGQQQENQTSIPQDPIGPLPPNGQAASGNPLVPSGNATEDKTPAEQLGTFYRRLDSGPQP